MCLGSSTSMQVRIIERAINISRMSPMTGIIPMIADQPNLKPQQQHVNDRSKHQLNSPGIRESTHSVCSSANFFEDFGIAFGESGGKCFLLWFRFMALSSVLPLTVTMYPWCIFCGLEIWIIAFKIISRSVANESVPKLDLIMNIMIPLCEESRHLPSHYPTALRSKRNARLK